MTRLGYQISSFSYPGVDQSGVFDHVIRQAVEAENSGFDTVMLMDHFFQLPGLGQPDEYMLECYTALGAIARETSRVRLSSLVTGNTYRNPAVLAKIITTLDVVSGGRAQLGIGAGWFELEHNSFGIEFGTFTDRFEKLEEALNIILPMLRGERPSLDGKWYTVTDAINEPPPVRRVPVMIGGSGERKTFRMVAQYADSANIICPVDQISHKLDVIAGHCETQGRDRSEIVVSRLAYLCVAPTHDEAQAELDAMLLGRGVPESKLETARANFHWGDPDEVAEEMASQMALGLDGFCVNSLANCWIPGRIELLGETLSRVVGL